MRYVHRCRECDAEQVANTGDSLACDCGGVTRWVRIDSGEQQRGPAGPLLFETDDQRRRRERRAAMGEPLRPTARSKRRTTFISGLSPSKMNCQGKTE